MSPRTMASRSASYLAFDAISRLDTARRHEDPRQFLSHSPVGSRTSLVAAEHGPSRCAGGQAVASVVESLEAAAAVGYADWARDEITAVIGEPLLERLLKGSPR